MTVVKRVRFTGFLQDDNLRDRAPFPARLMGRP
jgi:hypothetical protein